MLALLGRRRKCSALVLAELVRYRNMLFLAAFSCWRKFDSVQSHKYAEYASRKTD